MQIMQQELQSWMCSRSRLTSCSMAALVGPLGACVCCSVASRTLHGINLSRGCATGNWSFQTSLWSLLARVYALGIQPMLGSHWIMPNHCWSSGWFCMMIAVFLCIVCVGLSWTVCYVYIRISTNAATYRLWMSLTMIDWCAFNFKP